MNQKFDVMIIGAGAAGIMASISAAQENKKVLLLEKMPKIATKLKATGGGRCNLTNTLPQDDFMRKFGKHGRFMSDALKRFTAEDLRDFFQTIGVQSHAPDGFRVFPITHNSSTILEALDKELRRLNIEVLCEVNITEISKENDVFIVQTADTNFTAEHLIIATGGLGYPTLGATGEGYTFAKNFGHSVTSLHPAMMPLLVKENPRSGASLCSRLSTRSVTSSNWAVSPTKPSTASLIAQASCAAGCCLCDFTTSRRRSTPNISILALVASVTPSV